MRGSASLAKRRWLLPNGQKLVLVLVLVLAPLMFFSRTYLTQQTRSSIQFHEQERTGLQYIQSATSLLEQLVKERTGSPADVPAAVAAAQAVDERFGSQLGTSTAWRSWTHALDTVRRGRTPSFAQYNQLTGALTRLIAHVGDTSNLILDPNLDSYHLMYVIVVRLPLLIDQVGQAAQLATHARSQPNNRDPLVITRSTIDSTATTIGREMRDALGSPADKNLRAAAEPPTAALLQAAAVVTQRLGRVLQGAPAVVDFSHLLVTIRVLDRVATADLDSLLAGRIATLDDRVATIGEILLGLCGLLLLMALGLSRSLRLVGQKRAELQHQALHDVLTGLPNRALILQRATEALSRARRNGTELAVMFVDLDDFKAVNDTHGHAAGDELLQVVSSRLTNALGTSATVGRLGGDEFVVLAEGAALAEGPEVIARRIQKALTTPFHFDVLGHVVLHVHASIGVAVGLRSSAADLLRDADVALYAAKDAGKDCYVLFDPEMQLAVQERLELETDLRGAIGTNQLFLLYQPTIDLRAELITGVEALLRWNHPSRGVITPDVFIPVAEESGLIVPIGRAVLAEACRQGAAWQAQGRPMSVAVNVSARQLENYSDFQEDVRSALDRTGLKPTLLILEITETILMADAARTAQQLRDLKKLGLRIAIDDFGTGYCSLAYLQQFPVDTLKIDRSFVKGIGKSVGADALIHTFVQLGKTFGIDTCAEGIEEIGQLRQLQREGCVGGQGYLVARPLSVAALEELVGVSGRGRLTQPCVDEEEMRCTQSWASASPRTRPSSSVIVSELW